jgi:hypothetical protein
MHVTRSTTAMIHHPDILHCSIHCPTPPPSSTTTSQIPRTPPKPTHDSPARRPSAHYPTITPPPSGAQTNTPSNKIHTCPARTHSAASQMKPVSILMAIKSASRSSRGSASTKTPTSAHQAGASRMSPKARIAKRRPKG